MCGISGWFNFSGKFIEPESIFCLTERIAHRGPDDEGYLLVNRANKLLCQFCGKDSPSEIKKIMPHIEQAENWARENQPDLAISHRRFSIIDPKPEGHQPFCDVRQKVWLSLNGEIYNYIEVREELIKLGYQFRTKSDTEVLIQAYLEWGEICFEKFNGMWAVALYDIDKRQLILCRDRTGERPLYWVRGRNSIIFASEIKALLDDKIYPKRQVNNDSIYNFLFQAVSDFDERTFFVGIESVPAATIVKVSHQGEISTRRFWNIPDNRPESVNENKISTIAEELRELLRSSVELRLRADVPINVALSGGMDSSSITAMAATIRGKEMLDTYSVRFAEKEWNEYEFADLVAERYKVKNFVIDPEHNWTWKYLSAFVKAMEEPFHAPDLVPDYIIRHKLSERGIRVNLSGIGGDELFAGYNYHRQLHILDLKKSGKHLEAIKTLALASDTTPIKGLSRFAKYKLDSIYNRFVTKSESETGWQTKSILGSEKFTLFQMPDSCRERLRSDLEWSLLPYWLRAGDKSSMAVPIEVRYPFLDHRLIEFAMQLPISLLIRNGWTKWILREAMKDMLPSEITWRKRKMGFPFPIVEWLSKSLPSLQKMMEEMENPFLAKDIWKNNIYAIIKADPWFVWRSLTVEMWHRYYLRGLEPLPNLEFQYREVKV